MKLVVYMKDACILSIEADGQRVEGIQRVLIDQEASHPPVMHMTVGRFEVRQVVE